MEEGTWVRMVVWTMLCCLVDVVRTEYTFVRGYVPIGSTIDVVSDLTLQEAENICDANPECVAFTYTTRAPKSNQRGTFNIFFKDSSDVVDDAMWASFVKVEEVARGKQSASVASQTDPASVDIPGCGKLNLHRLKKQLDEVMEEVDKIKAMDRPVLRGAAVDKECAFIDSKPQTQKGRKGRPVADPFASERCLTQEAIKSIADACSGSNCIDEIDDLRKAVTHLCDTVRELGCKPALCAEEPAAVQERVDAASAGLDADAGDTDAPTADGDGGGQPEPETEALGAAVGHRKPPPTAGSAQVWTLDDLLVGCYDVHGDKTDMDTFHRYFVEGHASKMTVVGCANHCRDVEFFLMEGGDCDCGDVFIARDDHRAPLDECGKACKHEEELPMEAPCGKHGRLAVYHTREVLAAANTAQRQLAAPGAARPFGRDQRRVEEPPVEVSTVLAVATVAMVFGAILLQASNGFLERRAQRWYPAGPESAARPGQGALRGGVADDSAALEWL